MTLPFEKLTVKTWRSKPQSKKEYDQNNLGQNNGST
jgi:hypothetical protein